MKNNDRANEVALDLKAKLEEIIAHLTKVKDGGINRDAIQNLRDYMEDQCGTIEDFGWEYYLATETKYEYDERNCE